MTRGSYLSGAELPPLPLDEWLPTKETLHRYAQTVGKVRLEHSPYRNHWWHVPLHVSPRGLPFEISFDFIAHELEVVTGSGRRAPLPDDANLLMREGYSHEVISFGFWPGDANLREPGEHPLAGGGYGVADVRGGSEEQLAEGHIAEVPAECLPGRREVRELEHRGLRDQIGDPRMRTIR